jgi:hypothetical protein
MIGFIAPFTFTQFGATGNYSAIAILHTFQFTVAQALRFSVFTTHRRKFKISSATIWTSVSQYRKKNNDLTHLDIDGVFLNKPHDIAEAFSKHFESVYNNSSPCSDTFPFVKHCTENLPLDSISNSDVQNTIK